MPRNSAVTEITEYLVNKQMGVLPEVEDTPLAQDDELPEFPRLPGPLGKLADGITPDIPYEYKALTAITYVGLALSGRVCLKSEPYLQTRFYACNIGIPNTGKTAVENVVYKYMSPCMPDVNCELSIDSGPALVEIVQAHPRTLYRPDELGDAFEKAKVTSNSRNSLFGEWLRLYQGNQTGRSVISKNGGSKNVFNVHFAICAGATPSRFANMWTGGLGSSSGLQSRFCLSFSDKKMPHKKTLDDALMVSAAVNELDRIINAPTFDDFTMSDGAESAIEFWSMEHGPELELEKCGRIVDMTKRLALLLTVTLGETSVSESTMNVALQFGAYQIAMQRRFMPDDSVSYVQMFENRILKFFERHPNRTERECKKSIKPERCPGGVGVYSMAWRNLTRADAIIKTATNRASKALWSVDE
jgi:Protein of unknown function (DUF3987)